MSNPIRLAALLTVLALAGCTPSPATQTPSGPSPAASTVPGTPSTVPSTPLSFQEQAARDLIATRFFTVQDQVASDFGVPLNNLYRVMSKDLVAERLKLYQGYRAKGVKQTGNVVVEVRSTKTGAAGEYLVEACVDVSAVTLATADGTTVSVTGAPTRFLHRFTVAPLSGNDLRATRDETIGKC